jgi:hypothetical protein
VIKLILERQTSGRTDVPNVRSLYAIMNRTHKKAKSLCEDVNPSEERQARA